MIYAIMTAFEEAASLLKLLPRIPATVNGHDLRIIVVDDGSTDATADVARALKLQTIIPAEVKEERKRPGTKRRAERAKWVCEYRRANPDASLRQIADAAGEVGIKVGKDAVADHLSAGL